MRPKVIVLNEISCTQKDKHCMFSPVMGAKIKRKYKKTKTDKCSLYCIVADKYYQIILYLYQTNGKEWCSTVYLMICLCKKLLYMNGMNIFSFDYCL